MLYFISALLGASAFAVQATATSSDMYVFAYTFQPQFCYGETSYPGCSSPQEFWYTHFTVHGLWPQFKDGGYEHDCTSEAFDEEVTDAIGWGTMTTYWPDVKYAEDDPEYTEFWVGNRSFLFVISNPRSYTLVLFFRTTSGRNMEPAQGCLSSIISIRRSR